MQCRVPGVDVVTNGEEEKWSWILTTRSDPNGSRDQTGHLIEQSRNADVVMRGDRCEEREQHIIYVIGSSTWLRHRYRLPNLVLGCSGQGSECVDRYEANADAAPGSAVSEIE